MSEIFNEAAGLAKEKLSPQEDVLDALYGKTEEAYEKFEKEPLLKQLALSMTPGIGNVIAAKEVDVFGGRAKEAFEEAKYGQAAGYGGLTALAALGTLPGVGLIGRGAKGAIRGGLKLLDDPMEKAIKEIGEKATLPKTPSRVFGKDPEKYTGPHSDFVRPEQGLKSLDEPNINSILKSDEALEQYGKDWKNVNRLSKSQRQKQKSKIKDAAKQFEEGTLTGKEFRNVVKSELPIKPINKMVDVPEFDEIIGALKPKQVKTGIVGLTKDLTGQRVATRLDIPSYDNYNKWIVSIHEGLKGPATGYAKSARLTDVVFGSSPKTGLKISKGDINKSTIARMEGNWNNIADDDTISFAEQLLKRKKNGKYIDEVGEEWIQVGMNPYRSSYFYDKATGQALQAADEVIQVGPLVFARGARKPTLSEYKKGFTVQTGKGKKVFKQGGQIVTGLAGLGENIVYRQDGGQTNFDEETDWYGDAEEVAAAYAANDPWISDTPIEVKQRTTPKPLQTNETSNQWINPDTGVMHTIKEPKKEEPDDRSWFARILESVGESLLYFLTGGIVDYEHSGKDMIGGDITRWGEQQPKGTVDLSLPVGVGGIASMIAPSVNVGVPGLSEKGMSMIQTPVTRLLSDLYQGDKDTGETYTDADAGVELPENEFFTRGSLREQFGLDALKKKLDEG